MGGVHDGQHEGYDGEQIVVQAHWLQVEGRCVHRLLPLCTG